MSPANVLLTLQQLLPAIKSARAAEPVLLQYAREHNLAPAVLVKMATTLNTWRTLSWMDHNQNDRGATIPVVDTEMLQEEYAKLPARGRNKSASASPPDDAPITISRLPDFFADVAQEHAVKSAHLKSCEPPPDYRQSFGERMQDVFGDREAMRNTREEIIDIASELVDCFRVKSAALQRQLLENPSSITSLFCDMHAATGYEKRALTEIRTRLDGFDSSKSALRELDTQVAKHASVKRWLLEDRTGLIPAVRELGGLRSQIDAAHELMTKLAAAPPPPSFSNIGDDGTAPPPEADIVDPPVSPNHETDDARDSNRSGGADPNKPKRTTGPTPAGGGERPAGEQKTGGPKDGPRPKFRETSERPSAGSSANAPKRDTGIAGDISTHIDEISAAVNTALGHIPDRKSTLDYLMGPGEGGVIPGMLGAYAPARRQAKIDRGVGDVQTVVNLQRVIATDPVLAEADPHALVSAFNDLRQSDPTISANPGRLRMALREAMQYEGLTSQSTKTMADIDKTQAQASAQRAKSMQEIYQT